MRRVGAEESPRSRCAPAACPAGLAGDLRLVEIEGIDLNTCGGTHVRTTAEIECLKLLGTEPMRGGTRVFFVAGGRALRRLGAHERRAAALRAALGAPDEALVTTVELKLEELRRTEKSLRAAEDELAGVARRGAGGRETAWSSRPTSRGASSRSCSRSAAPWRRQRPGSSRC